MKKVQPKNRLDKLEVKSFITLLNGTAIKAGDNQQIGINEPGEASVELCSLSSSPC